MSEVTSKKYYVIGEICIQSKSTITSYYIKQANILCKPDSPCALQTT